MIWRTLLCDVPEEGGGVLSIAFLRPRLLALVMHRALQATVTGLLVELNGGTAKQLWRRGLTGDIYHVWRGHRMALNSASVVAAGDCLLVAGGTERLAIDRYSGKVVARSSAPASPSAKASTVGDALVVPEGQLVSLYDSVTLQLRLSKPTPRGTWAWAPAASSLAAVSDEENAYVGLWSVETDEVHVIAVPGPARQLIVLDDLAVVAAGSGAAERLAAVGIAGGALRWCTEFVDLEPPRPHIQGRPVLAHTMCLSGPLLIAAVATPAVVALDVGSGEEQWLTGLSGYPTALALHRGVLWLGAQDRSVTCIDPGTGTVLGGLSLEPGDYPVAFAGLPGSDGVLGVGSLGRVHRFDLDGEGTAPW